MKRLIALILTAVVCLSVLPCTASAAVRNLAYEEALAQELKDLGVFRGVSDTDFALGRAPTRVEAMVMLIRALGKEQTAMEGVWRHPFTDVPNWADKYVGYAYVNGLTNGSSPTEFGSGDANAAMFVTFMLRALGYSDVNGADFVWSDPFTLATTVGLLSDRVDLEAFLRADVVIVTHRAMGAYLKGSSKTLAGSLIEAGVFTQQSFDTYYNKVQAPEPVTPSVDTGLTAEELYAKCSPAVFYIELYDKSKNAIGSGSGFFIDNKGTAVTNYHVIEDAHYAYIQMSDSGDVYEVTGIYDYNKVQDWAVIKVNCSGNAYLKIGSPDTAVGATTVYAIGSPLGLQNTISQGIISNPNRTDGSGAIYIQISAAISPGSSGGALLNKYGEVIGITTAGFENGQNLNLAVPVSLIDGYNTSELKTVAQVGSNSPDKRQQEAFELLRIMIETTGETDSLGNKEILVESDKADFGMYYVEEDNHIVAYLYYYFEDERTGEIDSAACIYVSFEPDSTETVCTYSYIVYDERKREFVDESNATIFMDASEFNENGPYIFDEYEGPTKAEDAKLALLLHKQVLDLVNTFFEQLEDFGDYSVNDFGYNI